MPQGHAYEKAPGEDVSSTEIDREDDPASTLLFHTRKDISFLSEKPGWIKTLIVGVTLVFSVVVIVLAGFGAYYIVAIDQVCLMRTNNYCESTIYIQIGFR